MRIPVCAQNITVTLDFNFLCLAFRVQQGNRILVATMCVHCFRMQPPTPMFGKRHNKAEVRRVLSGRIQTREQQRDKNEVKRSGKSIQHSENRRSTHRHLHHGGNGKPFGGRAWERYFAFEYPMPCLEYPIGLCIVFGLVLRRIKVAQAVGLGINDYDISLGVVAVQNVPFCANCVAEQFDLLIANKVMTCPPSLVHG